MKVYQLIFKLLLLRWSAEVYLVYQGETVPIAKPFKSKNGKVVIMKSPSEFFLNSDDMSPPRRRQ